MTNFSELQKEAYEISKSRGWYTSEAENIAGKIALIHAELSEALEEYRDDRMELYYPTPIYADPFAPLDAVDPGKVSGPARPHDVIIGNILPISKGKPEGFGIELADTVIRIMDLAEYLKIDLEGLIKLKMEYNKTRSFRHGGKRI